VFDLVREVGVKILKIESNDANIALQCFKERLHGTTRKVAFHHPAHTLSMMLLPLNWDVDFAVKYQEEYANMRLEFSAMLRKMSRTVLMQPMHWFNMIRFIGRNSSQFFRTHLLLLLLPSLTQLHGGSVMDQK
jgi:hypothetical protein